MALIENIIYREDYAAAMEYLAHKETKHAPKFNLVSAPVELQELLAMAYMPRGEERSKWLNDFSKKGWSLPDGEAEVLLPDVELLASPSV